jgi:hypothetical protein
MAGSEHENSIQYRGSHKAPYCGPPPLSRMRREHERLRRYIPRMQINLAALANVTLDLAIPRTTHPKNRLNRVNIP